MAPVAERMSDNAVRARLRDETDDETVDGASDRRARRSSSELLIGLLLIAGGALAALMLFQRANSTEVLVAASRDLTRGSIVSRDDLVALEVPVTDAVLGVRAEQAGSLLGKRLLVDLPGGSLLQEHVLTEEEALGSGDAYIPLTVDSGSVPSGLRRGDTVRVVMSFPDLGEDGAATGLLSDPMTVFDVGTPGEFGDSVTVTVRASVDVSLDLARADGMRLLKVSAP